MKHKKLRKYILDILYGIPAKGQNFFNMEHNRSAGYGLKRVFKTLLP